MPINTASALAVSLIPAAVILVYNIMENGVPGGTVLKNFIGNDNTLSDSASSISLQNISILVNSSSENATSALSSVKIEPLIAQITNQIASKTSTTKRSTSTIIPSTETPTTSTTTTSTTTSTTTVPTTTSTTTVPTTTSTTSVPTTTTTTPIPVNLSRLPICCNQLQVTTDNRIVGNCEDLSSVVSATSSASPNQIWNVPSHLMSSGLSTKYSLQTVTPRCRDGKFIGQLPLSPDASSADHFLADGMLKYNNEYYRPNEYCIRGNGKSGEILEIQICDINCTNPETPCVHKCCEYDEIYSMGMKGHRGGCLRMDPSKNESLWSPSLYDENGVRMSAAELEKAGILPHVIQSNPTSFRHMCPRNATTVFPYGKQVADFLSAVLKYPFSSLKFMMRKDGWLMNPNEGAKSIAISRSKRTTKYCIDGVMNYGKADEPFMNIEDQTVLFLCLGAPEELATYKDPKSENLLAASSNVKPVTASPATTTTVKPSTTTTTVASTTSTTTSTTPSTTTSTTTPTTTTSTTTTPTTTTSTTTTPTTTTSTTTPSTTTSTSTTTTTPRTTTSSTTTAATTTVETTAATTSLPITTDIPTTTTTEAPLPPPVLPVCCEIDPNSNDDNGNEISHHCKTSSNEISGNKMINSSLWIASPNFMQTHKVTKFRLEVQPLKCKKWTKEFVHDLGKLLSPVEPVLMPDGMLKMGNDYFRKGEFCVNGIFRKTVEVLVCKTNCSDPLTPCVQKCCAPNEIYSLGVGGKKRGCIPLSKQDTPFDPPLYKNMATKVPDEELENMTPHLVQKYPPKFQYNCYKNVTLVFPFSSDVVQLMSPLAQINLEFKLRQDGKVIYKHPSIRDATGELIESAFSTYNFCVDGIRHWGEPEGPYRNVEDQTILFVCAVNPPAGP